MSGEPGEIPQQATPEPTMPKPSVPETNTLEGLSRRVQRVENRSAFYEVWWPLLSSTFGSRPLHMWDVRRRAHIQEGQRVLEIGAGYPLWRIYSGKVGKTGDFFALDFNEAISKKSRKITRLLNLGKEKPSEQIITADANNLPFRDESMDIIITSGMDNASTQEDIFREAFRVLAPKGHLISSEMGHPYPDIDILRKVGFSNIRKRIGTPFGLPILFNWFLTASKPLPKDALR